VKSGTNTAIQLIQVRVSCIGSCLICMGWNVKDVTKLPVKSKYIGASIKQLAWSIFYATIVIYYLGDLPSLCQVDLVNISVKVARLDSSYI